MHTYQPVLNEDDLLNAKVSMICHQVNCQGKMNSGVAKDIRTKYPIVYEQYKDLYTQNIPYTSRLLGTNQYICISGIKAPYYVCNMFAQDRYGYDGKTYTSIEAFERCLYDINRVNIGCTVAFPYKIGCVRGGAKWDDILPLIQKTLKDVYELQFYKLNKG